MVKKFNKVVKVGNKWRIHMTIENQNVIGIGDTYHKALGHAINQYYFISSIDFPL